MAITRGQIPAQIDGKLRGARKKKAPSGYHYMPNGRLMKDTEENSSCMPIEVRVKLNTNQYWVTQRIYYNGNRKRTNISTNRW